VASSEGELPPRYFTAWLLSILSQDCQECRIVLLCSMLTYSQIVITMYYFLCLLCNTISIRLSELSRVVGTEMLTAEKFGDCILVHAVTMMKSIHWVFWKRLYVNCCNPVCLSTHWVFWQRL
jgi:hypothetical protein